MLQPAGRIWSLALICGLATGFAALLVHLVHLDERSELIHLARRMQENEAARSVPGPQSRLDTAAATVSLGGHVAKERTEARGPHRPLQLLANIHMRSNHAVVQEPPTGGQPTAAWQWEDRVATEAARVVEALERTQEFDMQCLLVPRGCVDYNNAIVAFDPSYKETGKVPAYVQDVHTLARLGSPRLKEGPGDMLVNGTTPWWPSVRLASQKEHRPHLRSPHSSKPGSVGLVLLWDRPDNFGHVMYAAARLQHAVDQGLAVVDGDDAVVIPLMSDGAGLPSYIPRLLKAALPGRTVISLDDAISQDQACFDHLRLCSVGSMVPPAKGGSVRDLGLRLKQLYLGNDEPIAALRARPTDARLKVVLVRRAPGSRLIVNQHELLAACQELDGMECVEHEFGRDWEEDLRMAASADILVARHGAALNNLVFMRPGAHVVEVRPCGYPEFFDYHFSKITQYMNYEVRFWTVDIEDDKLCEPGPLEDKRIGEPLMWGRDRQVAWPVESFRSTLELVQQTVQRDDYVDVQKKGGCKLRVDGSLYKAGLTDRASPK